MSEEKGEQLMQEGEKRLTKFAPFTSSEEKHETAREKFIAAATQFKACNNWARAASAYERAADMSTKLKSEMDLAEDCQNAALAYRKIGDPRASQLLTKVVDMYDKNGKYSQAAKFCVNIADSGDPDAVDWYKRAIRYYRNENSRVTANELVEKMAMINIKKGEYAEARETYEKLANEALDDRLSRGSARKLFFMALLCNIADLSSTNIAEGVSLLADRFNDYTSRDPQFTEHTREHMLIRDVIVALENSNPDAYADAVAEFDEICPLDDIKMKMLLRGKQAIRHSDIR